jgi:hypothetical protein
MWKEARTALAKQATERGRRSNATGNPADLKVKRAGPSAERMDVGERWSHVVRRWRVFNATTPTQVPNSVPQPVTEAPKQPNVIATRKTAKPEKPECKTTAATKAATVKSKDKAAASVKLQQPPRRLLLNPRIKQPRV